MVPELPTHIEFESWAHLVQALLSSNSTLIWRGQSDYEWTLSTSLSRQLRTFDPKHATNWDQLENSAISYFMDRAAGLLEVVPDEHDLLAWLAFMQHYGAPTRLLDWSLSPFVAVYFAYEYPKDADAALYALDYYLARRINVRVLFPWPWDHLGTMASTTTDKDGNSSTTYPSRSLYRQDRENDILRWAIQVKSHCPLPTMPFQQDARMAGQQTVMTLMGDLDTVLDDWFDKAKWKFPDHMPGQMIAGTDSTIWPLDHPSQLLKKIRLRHEWRHQALQSLELMGITASSLFPGLDGIGRAASAHLRMTRLTARDVMTGWVMG